MKPLTKMSRFWHSKESVAVLNWGRISIPLDYFEQKSLFHLVLRGFFCKPSPQFGLLDMTLVECKELPDSAVMSKWHKKEMKLYQQFDVDVICSASNFIKNKTPAQVFSSEFWEIFQPAILQPTKNKSPPQVFSY